MSLLTPRSDYEYPTFVQGDGIFLITDDGTRYMDGSSGAIVANIGHGVESVANVMSEQASRLAYVSRLQGVTPQATKLAETIVREWCPSGLTSVWFSSSGADAIESAFRIARQYHLERGQASRYKIVSTWQSYHGSTMGALAASGREGPRAMFQPYFTGAWPHVNSAYCYRSPYGSDPEVCGARTADELDAVISREGPDTIAAFIFEPVVGTTTAGTHPPKVYFERVREICDRHGVLLIVDEIMSGFGRTGARMAVDHWGMTPDILVCGKGLGSGYVPLFATVLRDTIVDAIDRGTKSMPLGNTYNANPLSCAIGQAVLDYTSANDLVSRAASVGRRIRAGLEELYRFDIVGDVRGLGLMQGVEFVADRESKKAFPPAAGVSDLVARAARRRRLLLTHRGSTIDGARGDTIFITPPLTISEGEADDLLLILSEAVEEVASAHGVGI